MALLKSLRGKIFITIFLLIAATVLLIGFFVLNELKDYLLQEKSHDALLSANVIANSARGLFDDNIHPFERERFTRQYSQQVDGRVLLINKQEEVLADSFGELSEEKLDLPEINSVLRGDSVTRELIIDDVYVLYALVPVFEDPDVRGLVMLSLDITPTFNQLLQVQSRIWYASVVGGALLAGLGYFFAGRLTRPLLKMSKVSRRLAAGELEQRVNIKGSQELEDMAQSFNYMADKLEKEDELKKIFISNASHELRSPLASIKALAESMLDDQGEDIEIYKEFMADICKEVNRLNNLGSNLLDFTRYENLKKDLELQYLSVAKQIKKTLFELAPAAQEKKVRLNYCGPDELYGYIEPGWFKVMLYNLVHNAIKFAPEREGLIIINAWQKENKLTITVEDNGEGIPETEQKQIFEPFYRVDKARSRKKGGSGLGLAIAQKIARAHLGDIDLKSRPGKTVFVITLPGK